MKNIKNYNNIPQEQQQTSRTTNNIQLQVQIHNNFWAQTHGQATTTSTKLFLGHQSSTTQDQA